MAEGVIQGSPLAPRRADGPGYQASEGIDVWYLAEILFAEPPMSDPVEYQCESCDVVLRADDAAEAYQKAVAWGVSHAAESPSAMRLLGVSQLTTIGDELGDGTEVCGRFFAVPSVWERAGIYIPPSHQLDAVRREAVSDTPLGEWLSPEQIARLKSARGDGPGA